MILSTLVASAAYFVPVKTPVAPTPAFDLTCTECTLVVGDSGFVTGVGGSFIAWGLTGAAEPNGECNFQAAGCRPTKGCEFTVAIQWDVGSQGSTVRLETIATNDQGDILRSFTVDSGHVSVPPNTTGGGVDDTEIPCGTYWLAQVTIRFSDPLEPVLKGIAFAECGNCTIVETP